MAIALVVSRMVLAVVFSLAAVAKLADQEGLRAALRTFRVPAQLVRPFALLLPATEFAVAAGLVTTDLARWAAVAALTLLLLFVAAIGIGLAQGYSLECSCFGRLRPSRLGRWSVLRNLALASLATFVVVAGPGGGDGIAAPLLGGHGVPQEDALIVGSAVFVSITSALFVVRARGRRWTRVGQRAPVFVFRALAGETVDLSGSDEGGTLLVFWDATCTACEQMLPHLEAVEPERSRELPRVLIISGDSLEVIRASGLRLPFVRDEARAIARAFGIPGRPAAVLVDHEGRIASDVILGTAPIVATMLEDWRGQVRAPQERS